jgi:hypothetical protein
MIAINKYTDVTLIHDETATLSTVSVGPLGLFSIAYTLNRIKAIAQNRSGQSCGLPKTNIEQNV